jgi:hypothetical protein
VQWLESMGASPQLHDVQSASLEQVSRSVVEPSEIEVDPPVPVAPPAAWVPPLPAPPPALVAPPVASAAASALSAITKVMHWPPAHCTPMVPPLPSSACSPRLSKMGQLTLSHGGVGKVHEDDLASPTTEMAPQQFEVGRTTCLQSLARVQVLAVVAMAPLES